MSYLVNPSGYSFASLAKNGNGVLNNLHILETMVSPTANSGIQINQYAVGTGALITCRLSFGEQVANENGGLADVSSAVGGGAGTISIPITYKDVAYTLQANLLV
jgi:hypothetical protein